MFYLTCTMISSVDLAEYGVSRDTDWVSVDCGTITRIESIGQITLACPKASTTHFSQTTFEMPRNHTTSLHQEKSQNCNTCPRFFMVIEVRSILLILIFVISKDHCLRIT